MDQSDLTFVRYALKKSRYFSIQQNQRLTAFQAPTTFFVCLNGSSRSKTVK